MPRPYQLLRQADNLSSSRLSSMIRRHPLAEQAAEELLRRIGSGEWALGAKLPGETTLAAQLGVGRSTIREAVRELAGRRVLESRQGAGVFVIALQAAEDWDKVLRKADITDVLEGRLAIETEGARLAATRRTPADLKNFRYTLADRQRAAVKAPDDWYIEADLAFHRAVVTAAHNAVLTELFDTFVPRIRRAMIDMLKLDEEHRHRHDQAAHEAIAEAIRAKDPDLAAARSREHLSAVRSSVN
jgi:DNA-binding FadR family transcriptional regulator